MILKGWHLESYGIFSDWTLDELGSGLTVLHGPNEAGKSTLLHFIRGVLFGYPTKSQEGYVPNLGGGDHGGRLFIEDNAPGDGQADAAHWVLERRVAQNRRPTLLRPDGTTAHPLDLDGLLHHADKTLFKSIFTFELSDLVAMEGKDAEKVRDRLFSAGISGAGKSASELGTLLKGEMEVLYKKSGKTPKLNVLLAELDALDATRKELVSKAKEYPLQKSALENLSAEAVSLKEQLSAATTEAERLVLLAKLWPLLSQRLDLEKEVAKLDAPDSFPVEGLARMEAQLEKLTSAKLEAGKLERRKAKLEEDLGELKPDQALLDAAHKAEWLQETLTLEQNRLDRFLKTERETEIARADFSQTLEELGKWWDADKVAAVDIGPERQAEVKELQEKLADAAQELEFSRRSGEKSEEVTTTAAPRSLQGFALLALAALLACRPFLNTDPPVLPQWAGPLLWGAAAIAAALAVWRFKATVKTAPTSAPATDITSAQDAFDEVSAQWQAALKGWGLTEGANAPPETALHLISELRNAKKELAELHKKEQRELALGEEITRWEEEACGRLPSPTTATAEKLVSEVQEFLRAALGELKDKERADKLRDELEQITADLAQLRDAKGVAAKELASLFEVAGAEEEEGYRHKAWLFESKKELSNTLNTLGAQITTLVGEGKEADTLLAQARTGQVDQWRNAYREASELNTALDARLAEVNREVGALEHEIRELEGSEELAQCQAKVEGLRTEAGRLARQWRVAALTRALVRNTLDEYTAENQPEALERASELFSALTDGRYLRVVQAADNEQLLVTRPDGAQLAAHQLSRGTREGLYICLRLALADQYGQRQGRLPLVMDDVLVNLDPVRAEATLKALAHFAEDNQVLFFTCHPETVERITRVDATARVLQL